MEGTGCLRWIGFSIFGVVLVGAILFAFGRVVGVGLIASCGC